MNSPLPVLIKVELHKAYSVAYLKIASIPNLSCQPSLSKASFLFATLPLRCLKSGQEVFWWWCAIYRSGSTFLVTWGIHSQSTYFLSMKLCVALCLLFLQKLHSKRIPSIIFCVLLTFLFQGKYHFPVVFFLLIHLPFMKWSNSKAINEQLIKWVRTFRVAEHRGTRRVFKLCKGRVTFSPSIFLQRGGPAPSLP